MLGVSGACWPIVHTPPPWPPRRVQCDETSAGNNTLLQLVGPIGVSGNSSML